MHIIPKVSEVCAFSNQHSDVGGGDTHFPVMLAPACRETDMYVSIVLRQEDRQPARPRHLWRSGQARQHRHCARHQPPRAFPGEYCFGARSCVLALMCWHPGLSQPEGRRAGVGVCTLSSTSLWCAPIITCSLQQSLVTGFNPVVKNRLLESTLNLVFDLVSCRTSPPRATTASQNLSLTFVLYSVPRKPAADLHCILYLAGRADVWPGLVHEQRGHDCREEPVAEGHHGLRDHPHPHAVLLPPLRPHAAAAAGTPRLLWIKWWVLTPPPPLPSSMFL